MSNEEEALPTVAYKWRDNAGVDQVSTTDPEEHPVHDWNELFGKEKLKAEKDVEALIQDKKNEISLDGPNHSKQDLVEEQHKLHVLHELLDEVQEQDG